MLTLYNTLTRKKEEFVLLNGKQVTVYQCGPTVYWTQHIGNMRAMVMGDLVVRTLRYLGYDPSFVRNYTDVGHLVSDGDTGEDKMEKGAKREGLSPKEIADKYIHIFEADVSALNTIVPTVCCRATEHIAEMIHLTQELIKSHHAYATDYAVYFDVSKFSNYTALSHQNLDAVEHGAGKGTVEDQQKKHATDFSLWVFKAGAHKNALQYWSSPFSSPLVSNGEGFPGWHIECSAMSMKYLGETIDIHIGGVEHIPVHHTNEIAQSEASTGKKFVRYWLHNEHLRIDGGKMAKSTGTTYSIASLKERKYHPLALRYFFLQAHYRSQQNFTFEALESSSKALSNLLSFVLTWMQESAGTHGVVMSEFQDRFTGAISDDINIPQALSIVWELVASTGKPSDKLATVLSMDSVLGLGLKKLKQYAVPSDIHTLIQQRQKFRVQKDFNQADLVRTQIEHKGYRVEDTGNDCIALPHDPLQLI